MNALTQNLTRNLREYGMMAALVIIVIVFQVLTDGKLLIPNNIASLVQQNAYVFILTIGMVMVIVAGHIDLSVGSVCGFIGALAAVLMVEYNWHFVPATLVCLLCGGLIGHGGGGQYQAEHQRGNGAPGARQGWRSGRLNTCHAGRT